MRSVVRRRDALFCIALLLAASGCGSGAAPPGGVPAITTLRLLSATGDSAVEMRDLRGCTLLFVFWTTGCENCRGVLRAVSELQDTHRATTLRVIGVSPARFRESDRRVTTFARHAGYRIHLARDIDAALSRTFGPRGIPDTFLLDHTGRLRASVAGAHAWHRPSQRQMLLRVLQDAHSSSCALGHPSL